MKHNLLAAAFSLSDEDLMARLPLLAANERGSTVELVAHLAALDARPALYAGNAFGSLTRYCVQVLKLSEDAAWNRVAAAKACRRFPVILDRLASGVLTLTAVRVVGRYLTPENHEAILARAAGATRLQLDKLKAELDPQPDVPSAVRPLPGGRPSPVVVATAPAALPMDASGGAGIAAPVEPAPILSAPPAAPPVPRPIVKVLAPKRYRVEFTIDEETHEMLRRLQDLLRREVPDGDPAVLFARAMKLLLADVEKRKLAATTKLRAPRPTSRSGTEDFHRLPSRHVPAREVRAVWRRDESRCAFVSPDGRRCSETSYLELHHIIPYAKGGPSTTDNLALRCWRHNQYEAELEFGRYGISTVREGVSTYAGVRPTRATRTVRQPCAAATPPPRTGTCSPSSARSSP